MSAPSVGLIALWTGQLSANVEHMKNMCIHQMDDTDVDEFEKYVQNANNALSAITNYIKETQES